MFIFDHDASMRESLVGIGIWDKGCSLTQPGSRNSLSDTLYLALLIVLHEGFVPSCSLRFKLVCLFSH